jgi:hypothetical protein
VSAGLDELRPHLLEVHRRLLEAERADMERFRGARISGAELLEIATGSMRLAWLAPLSELIVAIDEAVDEAAAEGEEPPAEAAAALRDRARELFAPPSPESAFGRRYLTMLQVHPAVVVAHGALVQALRPERPR